MVLGAFVAGCGLVAIDEPAADGAVRPRDSALADGDARRRSADGAVDASRSDGAAFDAAESGASDAEADGFVPVDAGGDGGADMAMDVGTDALRGVDVGAPDANDFCGAPTGSLCEDTVLLDPGNTRTVDLDLRGATAGLPSECAPAANPRRAFLVQPTSPGRLVIRVLNSGRRTFIDVGPGNCLLRKTGQCSNANGATLAQPVIGTETHRITVTAGDDTDCRVLEVEVTLEGPES
ncbi:MAG: hypothetical protein AAF938_20575 [Myxococcota bacterium]